MAQYILHIDGASRGNPGPSSIGVLIQNDKNETIQEVSEPIGEATNNMAEYMALIYGLQAALALKGTRLHIKTDSELLAKQWSGVYKVKEMHIRMLYRIAKQVSKYFENCQITHVPREQNREADRLANEALDSTL